MCILKKLKSLIIISALLIMAGLAPCFAEEEKLYPEDLMTKQELTVYEQYLKDYAEQIEKIFTPEKNFPQKQMDLYISIWFYIQPDGSIRLTEDISNYSERASHGDPFWPFHMIYYARLTSLSRKYEQYIKDMLVNNPAKPFPEDFGENISVCLDFRHWNHRFRKPVYETVIESHSYSFTKKHFAADVYRGNYTSGK